MGEVPVLAFKEFHPEQKRTLLFLHGGAVSGWMWQPVVQHLPGFHCLVPDLPEHGASRAVMPFGIELAAEKCAELIRQQAHGGEAVVVGLSEGAQVVVQMLAASPQVMRAAMISSALLLPIAGSRIYSNQRLLAFLYRWSMSQPFHKDWWIRLNMRYSAGVPDEFFTLFKEDFKAITQSQFVNLMSANQAFRLPQGLGVYQNPVLVAYGRHEYKAMRDSARLLAKTLPHARLLGFELPRHSTLAHEHNWALTAPQLFADTLRNWLEVNQI